MSVNPSQKQTGPPAPVTSRNQPTKQLIPGLNHPLTVPSFITASQYNSLPPLSLQPKIPSSVLRRFGQIVTAYNLQDAIGAHLIYNRWAPGGIAEGSFVATTKVPLNPGRIGSLSGSVGKEPRDPMGGFDTTKAYTNQGMASPQLKKMVWQSGIWELGMDTVQNSTLSVDVNLVHGRLYMLSRGPPAVTATVPKRPRQHSQSANQAQQSQVPPVPPHVQLGQQIQFQQNIQFQHQVQPQEPRKQIDLGYSHHFLAYEYEYGPLPRALYAVPDAFWEEIADFILENGLQTRLALEVLDAPDPLKGRTGVGRFVVEEFDPTRSRKAAVVEVPGGKEISWGFSRTVNIAASADGTSNPDGSGLRGEVEVEVEVNLVRASAGLF